LEDAERNINDVLAEVKWKIYKIKLKNPTKLVFPKKLSGWIFLKCLN
jgi:hypothetical protein